MDQSEPRENEGTERDIQGVGWDMSIPLKVTAILCVFCFSLLFFFLSFVFVFKKVLRQIGDKKIMVTVMSGIRLTI